ncbi:MAG: hypothetical protein EOO04_36525, partial [Chitinophagaceae bacterium]
MTRIVLMNILALLTCQGLFAQPFTHPAYTVGDIATVRFSHTSSSAKGKIKAEVPPWIVAGGLKSYFFVDGSETYIWSSPASFVH